MSRRRLGRVLLGRRRLGRALLGRRRLSRVGLGCSGALGGSHLALRELLLKPSKADRCKIVEKPLQYIYRSTQEGVTSLQWYLAV